MLDAELEIHRVQWGAQRAVGWEMKVPTEPHGLQGQRAARQHFSECKIDQGGIIRASSREACTAELSCQPEPSHSLFLLLL